MRQIYKRGIGICLLFFNFLILAHASPLKEKVDQIHHSIEQQIQEGKIQRQNVVVAINKYIETKKTSLEVYNILKYLRDKIKDKHLGINKVIDVIKKKSEIQFGRNKRGEKTIEIASEDYIEVFTILNINKLNQSNTYKNFLSDDKQTTYQITYKIHSEKGPFHEKIEITEFVKKKEKKSKKNTVIKTPIGYWEVDEKINNSERAMLGVSQFSGYIETDVTIKTRKQKSHYNDEIYTIIYITRADKKEFPNQMQIGGRDKNKHDTLTLGCRTKTGIINTPIAVKESRPLTTETQRKIIKAINNKSQIKMKIKKKAYKTYGGTGGPCDTIYTEIIIK